MRYEELEPKSIFDYFRKISDIPRGSGNEAAVARYIYDTARQLGHEAAIDGAGNVFVRAAATPGYEDHPAVMLQGHMDMVCEANRGVTHDFLRDPIEFVLDGEELHANGTTLGADDGVADAIMLALLSSDVPHPALECLFTTSEETGMDGMRGFDPSLLTARRLINLDSAGEGEATVSCAGGVHSHICFPAAKSASPASWSTVTLEIGGLFGGHSGEDIHLGRANAIVLCARLLYAASKSCGIRLASMEGGRRDNAIPRECTAQAAVSDVDAFRAAVDSLIPSLAAEMIPDDASFRVSVRPSEPTEVLSEDETMRLISLLMTLPNGVYGMSRAVPGLVETSANLAVIRPGSSGFEIVVSCRSSVESRLDEMQDKLECAILPYGATVDHSGRYPGWDYLEGSPMQALYLETYEALFGRPARVIGIHAGLECGLLKGKIPDMDIISIGPELRDLHSPSETLNVASFARLWTLVCELLRKA